MKKKMKKSEITKFKGVGNFRTCNAMNGVSERKCLIRSEKIKTGDSCNADKIYTVIYINIYRIRTYVCVCVNNIALTMCVCSE